MPGTIVFTIGHSNHSAEYLVELFALHTITAVADVRSAPYSRFNPQFNREAIEKTLKNAGIAYVFLGEELGARPKDKTCYENGKASFKRLAERRKFRSGIERVIKGSESYKIALMCAEKEPLDCHRTILVSRELIKCGVNVQHILPDGKTEEHADTEQRLLKLVGDDTNLFEQSKEPSELLEIAYKQQENRISHESNPKRKNNE
ncbi:MAG: DUF488 domain-containing protein [Planctomycetota bacterium]|jgi:uncharacterized protein (DUF488 family)